MSDAGIEVWQPPPRPQKKQKRVTLGKAAPDSPSHAPRAETLPRDLESKTVGELEGLLLHAEYDILAAEILAADERRMSSFMKGPGLAFLGATVPLAIADFEPIVLAIVGVLGLILFTLGSLSIRPAKLDAALTARKFDHDRIIRAIGRIADDATGKEDAQDSRATASREEKKPRNERT